MPLHALNSRISSGFDSAPALFEVDELATWRIRNVRLESGDLYHVNLLGLTENWGTALACRADEIWSRKPSLLEVLSEMGLDRLMWRAKGAPKSLVRKLCSLTRLPMSWLTLRTN